MKQKRINVTETFLPPQSEYQQLLEQVWETKWLTNRGALVLDLEEQLKNKLSISQTPLLVSNGTLAIQIPIKALELTGEIITTPFSYVATTSTIVWENCTPIFVDIDPDFLTIDETKIEAAITDKTSAILAVHVYGNPCNVEKIEAIAKKHNLKVIYDAAHCFGVKYNNKSVFEFGDVSTTSFHATKLYHTGEGGAIFCNDEDLRKTIFYHHNFGHNGPEEFWGLGINAKMGEINAAMGLAVLPYMDHIIEDRKKSSTHYDNSINWDKLQKPSLRPGTEYNYAYYPVIFESEEALLKIQKELNNENIYPRRYFYPSLNTLPYLPVKKMSVSEDISSRVLCLPLYVGIEANIIEKISSVINQSL